MSHYVTKPTHASRKYYIFSTVVMAPITKKMWRTEMEQWLKDNEGYEGFLDPRPLNEQYPEAFPEPLDDFSKTQLSLMYWNGSFWYVTEDDNYYV